MCLVGTPVNPSFFSPRGDSHIHWRVLLDCLPVFSLGGIFHESLESSHKDLRRLGCLSGDVYSSRTQVAAKGVAARSHFDTQSKGLPQLSPHQVNVPRALMQQQLAFHRIDMNFFSNGSTKLITSNYCSKIMYFQRLLE